MPSNFIVPVTLFNAIGSWNRQTKCLPCCYYHIPGIFCLGLINYTNDGCESPFSFYRQCSIMYRHLISGSERNVFRKYIAYKWCNSRHKGKEWHSNSCGLMVLSDGILQTYSRIYRACFHSCVLLYLELFLTYGVGNHFCY